MQLTVKKQIGKTIYTFIVEGSNLYEMVSESNKLSFPDVHKCGCCGGDHLFLATHEAEKGKQKFKYTTIRCGNSKCKASVNFGQRTDNPDVYYLRTRDEDGKKVYDWRKPGESTEYDD